MLNTLNLTDLALHNGAQQKTTELGALVNYLRPFRRRTVVEIGFRKGGTLVLWLLIAAKDAVVISLDLPFGTFGGGDFTEDLKSVSRFREAKQQLHLIRGDSHVPGSKAAIDRLLKGRQIDLLFIDGDHTYTGVKQDYEIFSPLVCDGGLAVFHNIIFHRRNQLCQVDRFWKEIKAGKITREFIDTDHTIGERAWGGIGVIRVERGKRSPDGEL